MDFDESRRNSVGEQLLRRLARGLDDGEITQEQASDTSGYILDTIDSVQDNVQLLTFLTTLSQKWPIFTEVLTLERGEVQEIREEQKVEEVENLLKEQKIDEALQVAESTTAQVDSAEFSQQVQNPPASEIPQGEMSAQQSQPSLGNAQHVQTQPPIEESQKQTISTGGEIPSAPTTIT